MEGKIKQLVVVLNNMRKRAIVKRDVPFVYLRFLTWQVRIRFGQGKKIIKWVNRLKLEMYPHKTVSTGNYYLGLLEFRDMAFVMHYLRSNDLMFDIGANIGDYALLAAGVSGAAVVAVEPIPETVAFMRRNIKLNGLGKAIKVEDCAVGSMEQQVEFFCNMDSVNRKADTGGGLDRQTCMVNQRRLDSLFEENGVPGLIKIDVEGYEEDVIISAGDKILNRTVNVIIAELNDKILIARLNEIGFRMYQYDPFKRELVAAEENDGCNGIFIRDIKMACQRVRVAAPFVINHMVI